MGGAGGGCGLLALKNGENCYQNTAEITEFRETKVNAMQMIITT